LVAAAVTLSCLFGFAASGDAAPSTKPLSLTKYTKHHAHKRLARRHIHRSKKARVAQKHHPKTADQKDKDNDKTAKEAAMPPQVANAHAELSAGDMKPKPDVSTLTDADKNAGPAASNGVTIATSDQLNDLDRDAAPAAQPVSDVAQSTPAPIEAVPAISATPAEQPASLAQVSQPHTDAWDSASLVGKIFIGAGVMLTLASAARLMIA